MSDTLADPRAYLQKRVALFTGVMCVFFTGMLPWCTAPERGLQTQWILG